jgi:hypothetical protein
LPQRKRNGKTVRYWEAFFVWLVLLACAILNGALREQYLAPMVGPRAAQFIGCGLLSAVIVLVAVVYIRYLDKYLDRVSLCLGLHIGALWLGLTVLFEFGFGHYVLGLAWAELFADYNILNGRCWPLVLAVTFGAPFIGAVVFSHRSHDG